MPDGIQSAFSSGQRVVMRSALEYFGCGEIDDNPASFLGTVRGYAADGRVIVTWDTAGDTLYDYEAKDLVKWPN